MNKDNKKMGFTLIELIVTLTMLSIMLAITIPMTIQYIEESRDGVTYVNAHAFQVAVQAVAIKEFANGNAYSNSSSGPTVTYEAITNTRPRPNDDIYNSRIQKIYDYLNVPSISQKFEAIAIVDAGIITIMRYKDLGSNKVFEWKREEQVWTHLNSITNDTPWAGEILPDSYTDRNIWWNGYQP